jgi:hypothetical protein
MTKSRRVIRTVHVACMGKKRNAYRVLLRKFEGKRQLRRSKHKREDNLKIHLTEMG